MEYTPLTTGIKDPEVAAEFRRLAEFLGPVYRLPVLYVAPVFPTDGDVVICDGASWNPLADGVKRPLWYDASVPAWKAI